MATNLVQFVNDDEFAWNVEMWRDIVRNNKRSIPFVWFQLETDETWLPNVLVQAGFFSSGGQVKKNRKDLWRDIDLNGETVALSWAKIRIFRVNSLDTRAGS